MTINKTSLISDFMDKLNLYKHYFLCDGNEFRVKDCKKLSYIRQNIRHVEIDCLYK